MHVSMDTMATSCLTKAGSLGRTGGPNCLTGFAWVGGGVLPAAEAGLPSSGEGGMKVGGGS